MKVLHVGGKLDDRTGGPIRAVVDLSAGALDLGLESEIVGIAPIVIRDNPFPLERMHGMSRGYTRYEYSSEFRGWMENNVHRFDGVILHGMWLYPLWTAARICAKAGVPYVCFPHGLLDLWPVFGQGRGKAVKKWLYWHWREKWVFENSASVFYTTFRELRNAEETFQVKTKHRIVVPYGVHTGYGEATFEAIDHPRDNVALFLGRLHPKKNVLFLIDAWASAKKGADWQLVIAGTGESGYIKEIREQVRRRGVENSVKLVGHVVGDEKTKLLQKAKWFVLPSLQENFGLAVVEAIGRGCAVVLSPEVYLGEYLHPKSEIIPLSIVKWVEFFEERLGDDSWRRELVALDRAFVCPRFQFSKIVDEWVASVRAVFNR